MERQLEQFNNQYSVTDTGIVYSLKGKKKELIGKITKSGYREVVLNHKGKKKYLLVHRLVASLFIENKNNAKTVNHKDGNKLNNSVSNTTNTFSLNNNNLKPNCLLLHIRVIKLWRLPFLT